MNTLDFCHSFDRVLLTSFIEKIDSQPNLGFFVGIAFAGFMVCILGTVRAYTNMLQDFGFMAAGLEVVKVGIALSIIWISLTVAIVALTLSGEPLGIDAIPIRAENKPLAYPETLLKMTVQRPRSSVD